MANLLGEIVAKDITSAQVIDASALAGAISVCFRMARDGGYSQSERGAFFAKGVALREQMKVLLTIIFTEGTDELQTANATLKTVNAALAAALEDVNEAADAIAKLGSLVAQLTRLVELVGIFL